MHDNSDKESVWVGRTAENAGDGSKRVGPRIETVLIGESCMAGHWNQQGGIQADQGPPQVCSTQGGVGGKIKCDGAGTNLMQRLWDGSNLLT